MTTNCGTGTGGPARTQATRTQDSGGLSLRPSTSGDDLPHPTRTPPPAAVPHAGDEPASRSTCRARTIASSIATAVRPSPAPRRPTPSGAGTSTGRPSSSVTTSSAARAVRCTRTPRGPRHAERGGTTTSTGSPGGGEGAPNQAAADRPPRTASAGITSAAPRATAGGQGRPGSAYTSVQHPAVEAGLQLLGVTAPSATAWEPRNTPCGPWMADAPGQRAPSGPSRDPPSTGPGFPRGKSRARRGLSARKAGLG